LTTSSQITGGLTTFQIWKLELHSKNKKFEQKVTRLRSPQAPPGFVYLREKPSKREKDGSHESFVRDQVQIRERKFE
jgi:hypothetical protein